MIQSFHSHFNAMFYIKHPDIFVFMHVLNYRQSESYVHMRSVNKPAPVHIDTTCRYQYTIDQYKRFIAGEINMRTYLTLLGCFF